MVDELDQVGAEAAQQEQAEEPLTGEHIPKDAPGPGGDAGPAPNQFEDLETWQCLKMVYVPLFSLLAPAWEVTEAECELLADAHGKVLDKYFPDGLNLGVEVTAICTTAFIIGPRLGQPRKGPAPQAEPDQKPQPERPDVDPKYQP